MHDAGKYAEAIAKYQQALSLDSTSYKARTEMAMTYFYIGEYDRSIQLCESIINGCTDDNIVSNSYVTYGNCLDNLNKYDEAVEVFKQGIFRYPDAAMLRFNLGIAYYKHKVYDEAKGCFQNALRLNPNHASSHLYLGYLMDEQKARIPAVLAYSRFLLLEPKGERAQTALKLLTGRMKENVEKGKGKNINVYMDPQKVNDTSFMDNFYLVDMVLTLAAAMDYDDASKDKNEIGLFVSKFASMCRSLEEQRPHNKGFFWEYYAPYFIEMEKRDFIEPFGYMIFYFNRDEKYIDDWVKNNQDKIEEVGKWSAEYAWPRN